MKSFLSVVVLAIIALIATTGTILADPYEEGSFTPINGGEFFADNGNFHWVAPATAYSGNLYVRRLPNGEGNLPPRPANTIVIGQPFTLQLIERTTSARISLDQPATLTLRYNPADLGGRSEYSLRVVRNVGHWVTVPSVVNPWDHTVTLQTPWGGDYLLLADNLQGTVGSASAVPMSSSITGRVFYDKDGNGVLDGEDFAIAGADLRISSGSWSAMTTTALDGSYGFWVLRESDYTVELVVGPEWAFTTPNVVSNIRVNGQADSQAVVDFGMWFSLQ